MIPGREQEQRNSKDIHRERWWPRHVQDHETTYLVYAPDEKEKKKKLHRSTLAEY